MENINPENPNFLNDLAKNDAKGNKSKVIDHKVVADLMIRFIAQMDELDPMSKKVMILKLINPGLTCLGISQKTGIPLIRVLQYEDEGKEAVKKQLANQSVEEGVKRFNHSEFGRTDVESLRLKPKGDITMMDVNNTTDVNDIEKL